jgi:hypothetical protein
MHDPSPDNADGLPPVASDPKEVAVLTGLGGYPARQFGVAAIIA